MSDVTVQRHLDLVVTSLLTFKHPRYQWSAENGVTAAPAVAYKE